MELPQSLGKCVREFPWLVGRPVPESDFPMRFLLSFSCSSDRPFVRTSPTFPRAPRFSHCDFSGRTLHRWVW